MKKNHVYRILLVAIVFQFAALVSSAQSVIAVMTVDGAKTGKFKGTSTMRGNKGKIDCIGYGYQVSSPRDAATGLPNGKRQHQPIKIVKFIDASTPQFLESLYTNEVLKSVVIEFYKKEPDGRMQPTFVIKLTNATISQVNQSGGVSTPEKINPGSVVEEISFTFQNIELTDQASKTTAVDSWNTMTKK